MEIFQSKLVFRYPDNQVVTIQRQDYVRLLPPIISFLVLGAFLALILVTNRKEFLSSLRGVGQFGILVTPLLLIVIAIFFLGAGWKRFTVFDRLKVDKQEGRIRGYWKTYADFDEVKHVYVRRIHHKMGVADRFLLGVRLRDQRKILLGEHGVEKEAMDAGIKIASLMYVPFEERK